MSEIGDRFQQETKYYRGELRGGGSLRRHELYKAYPGLPQIALPMIAHPPAGSLHNALTKRKSTRSFADTPLTLETLSYLLWATTGISRISGGYEFRTAPSAGALYPIETYICAVNVEGLDPGIYHYAIRPHAIEQVKAGSFAKDLARAALDQQMCAEAAAVFVWTAVFGRSKAKYKQRAYRYVYLDTGHIAQNLALAAAALDLGACCIAAIYDDEANEILDVDGTEESVIYMTALGNHRQPS